MCPEAPLLDSLLSELAAELDDGTTIALALTGSHARGEATPYSDVDLLRFVAVPPEKETERYSLKYWGGYLISVSTTTIAAKQEELARPETAIWAVPGLRQARILLDKDGSLGELQRAALAFTWEPWQAAADEYASHVVVGDAEEVHKILGALMRRDESAILYGTLGLVLGLARAVAVQRGLLIQTENSFFRQVQEAVGRDSAWTHDFRLAAGFKAGPADLPPVEVRGIAGLHLYRETVRLLRSSLLPAHLEVIDSTLDRIQASGLTLPDRWAG